VSKEPRHSDAHVLGHILHSAAKSKGDLIILTIAIIALIFKYFRHVIISSNTITIIIIIITITITITITVAITITITIITTITITITIGVGLTPARRKLQGYLTNTQVLIEFLQPLFSPSRPQSNYTLLHLNLQNATQVTPSLPVPQAVAVEV
jgi:hypothetical protein